MTLISRRKFIKSTLAVLSTLPFGQFKREIKMANYLPARIISGPKLLIPEHQRPPFNWHLTRITSLEEMSVSLHWDNLTKDVTPKYFRITVGLDERDEKTVEAFLPNSKRIIGTMDLNYASQFQIYQLLLESSDISDIRDEGLALRVSKGEDLQIFVGGENVPDAFKPHLLLPGESNSFDEYFVRMNSIATIQQFGWMLGCVLDGLIDLSELSEYKHLREIAKKQLAMFIKNNQLIYENHLSSPSDGVIYGIEGTLPFAALAKLYPNHHLIDLALKFWQSNKHHTGSIQDGGTMTSEGAYTIGYPMAVIAQIRGSKELMKQALNQISIRQEHLFTGNEFWRVYRDNGEYSDRNWARGIAWQLLGYVRTLSVLKNRIDISDYVNELQQISDWIISMQLDDGLWSVYVDEQDLTPDTGGSAGIAAALAIGAKHDFLNKNAELAARKTLFGLKSHMTPDGFLNGVSQSNKGGEALQRGEYRSIYQMGMGLMAQLIAALRF